MESRIRSDADSEISFSDSRTRQEVRAEPGAVQQPASRLLRRGQAHPAKRLRNGIMPLQLKDILHLQD